MPQSPPLLLAFDNFEKYINLIVLKLIGSVVIRSRQRLFFSFRLQFRTGYFISCYFLSAGGRCHLQKKAITASKGSVLSKQINLQRLVFFFKLGQAHLVPRQVFFPA